MKGICFKEPLFHATIEGRKTMTRRIMKPQPQGCFVPTNDGYSDGHYTSFKPRYRVGEIVYLKEPYRLEKIDAGLYKIHYQFGSERIIDVHKFAVKPIKIANIFSAQKRAKSGFANKLFMPEWCARYFIKITAVRSEWLQDISDEDCLKEGVVQREPGIWGLDLGRHISNLGKSPREAFATLIDKINGRGTWERNPCVWAYDYELI